MNCIICGCEDTKVVDSRTTLGGTKRRRRECLSCGYRFTTYESTREQQMKQITEYKEEVKELKYKIEDILRKTTELIEG